MPTVKQAVAGWRGFDVNAPLPANKYSDFARAGNNFAIRYIPRSPALVKGNLTAVEIDAVMSAKIALSVVQHCPEPGWQPSASLGTQYGQYAGQYALEIGLPKGMNIWLDLETPSNSATAQDTIAYANAWYDAIQSAGYIPGYILDTGCHYRPPNYTTALNFLIIGELITARM